MDTQVLSPSTVNIMRCAARIKAGGLVAFPTETVYALGADATNAAAVKRLYEVKNRPSNLPLIVAVAKKSDIEKVAKNIPQKAGELIERFMPGAFTVILDKADGIPSETTGGGNSVAVRIPDNPIALKLIELCGKPVVVPSANTSTKPAPTSAKHVLDDLAGKIEYVLDGGESEIGIESTVVDVRSEPYTVIRAGGTPIEDIEKIAGKVLYKRNFDASVKKNAPVAEVFFSAYYDDMSSTVCAKYDELTAFGRTPVILCLNANAPKYAPRKVFTMGESYDDYAHNLFAALRSADENRFDCIIAEGVRPIGIGLTLIQRLCRISNGQII